MSDEFNKDLCDARHHAADTRLANLESGQATIQNKLDILIERTAEQIGFKKAFPYIFSVLITAGGLFTLYLKLRGA